MNEQPLLCNTIWLENEGFPYGLTGVGEQQPIDVASMQRREWPVTSSQSLPGQVTTGIRVVWLS